MKIPIEPQQLAAWVETFVPPLDLFFVEETDLLHYGKELAEVLVIPQQEFMAHSEYRRLEFATNYQYWNIAKHKSHVLVAQPQWVERLNAAHRTRLLQSQADAGRGLVFPASLLPEAPLNSVVELDGRDVVALQSAVWERLARPVKERFLAAYALLWDTPDAHMLPEGAPGHLSSLANRYSAMHGSNCLSAVLFAISGQAWIAGEWVHPQTFQRTLHQYGYAPCAKEADSGDVVIWSNAEGIVQHASYCLGKGLFFNKNGQTFFNPWKVIDQHGLYSEWKPYSRTVYCVT